MIGTLFILIKSLKIHWLRYLIMCRSCMLHTHIYTYGCRQVLHTQFNYNKGKCTEDKELLPFDLTAASSLLEVDVCTYSMEVAFQWTDRAAIVSKLRSLLVTGIVAVDHRGRYSSCFIASYFIAEAWDLLLFCLYWDSIWFFSRKLLEIKALTSLSKSSLDINRLLCLAGPKRTSSRLWWSPGAPWGWPFCFVFSKVSP